MTIFDQAIQRFETDQFDQAIISSAEDPRISTPRHREATSSALRRGYLLGAVGALTCVLAIPGAIKLVSAITPERFSCDPTVPQVQYQGPNAFSVATRIPGVDVENWENVPLRQTQNAEPVAAANVAHTFTGTIYGPADCQ